MMLGVKVSPCDYRQMLEVKPEAVEFSLQEKDLKGYWVEGLDLDYFFPNLIVHAPILFENGSLVDIAAEDKELRKKSLLIILKTFELACKLCESGCFKNNPVVVLHPGGIAKQEIEIPEQRLKESIEKILSQVDSTRYVSTIENMPQFYRYKNELYTANIFKKKDEITRLLEHLQIKLCLDLSHAKLYCNHASLDFYDYIRSLSPYTVHIHASDARGVSGEGVQIGEGEIDFKKTLAIFKNRDVTIVPEVKGGHDNRGEGFKTALERLRSIDC